jgi:electron-transferring-flavoprotein dehydrogenase
MEKTYDVLVIGGCTAGLYFGGLMARQGYKVLIADKSPEDKLGGAYTIIHIGEDSFTRFGLPVPREGDPDYVRFFDRSVLRSASNKWAKSYHTPILVLRRSLLMKRLAAWAREQGAETLYDVSFERPLFDSRGKLAGAVLRQGPREIRVNALLTADASGLPAVLRTSLPPGYGMETFVMGPRDMSYVILHYVKLTHPENDTIDCVCTWPYYRIWLGPQMENDGAIMGVGAALSFEHAERCFNRFLPKGYLPGYTLQFTEKCNSSRHRTPFSFTADGFIALGDAACITNPMTGEGVPYAWLLCSIAAEEYGRIMRNGVYPSREAVWAINTRYNQEQGASYAGVLAARIGTSDCTAEENDYEFEQSIFYEDEGGQDKRDIEEKLRAASGGLSPRTLEKIRKGLDLGREIHAHYLRYPGSPRDLESWSKEAGRLWAETGNTGHEPPPANQCQ